MHLGRNARRSPELLRRLAPGPHRFDQIGPEKQGRSPNPFRQGRRLDNQLLDITPRSPHHPETYARPSDLAAVVRPTKEVGHVTATYETVSLTRMVRSRSASRSGRGGGSTELTQMTIICQVSPDSSWK